ncbi:hypothetical protein E1176_06710 [Fulvivirga sp. RKSG066]|uniref:hypothetical protein n=1 Tax=Fulvivirga aurantia TaxID=2529383 RepID=UPI0012BCDF78|nr:hypothetical protein [Fulvivirga aurantia]MTI20706.1 hypothetical protein [Fulvivirga aurantia]
MKNIILLLVTLSFATVAYGQNTTAREKIESARIALITERLGLTPEQAEKFWPLYNEFRTKNEALKKEYEVAKRSLDPQTATDKDKRQLLELGLKLKEQKLQIEKDYSGRMLRIISAQQIMSLRKAEDDFRRMLLDQIQKRRLQQGRRNQIRDKVRDRRNGDGN